MGVSKSLVPGLTSSSDSECGEWNHEVTVSLASQLSPDRLIRLSPADICCKDIENQHHCEGDLWAFG